MKQLFSAGIFLFFWGLTMASTGYPATRDTDDGIHDRKPFPPVKFRYMGEKLPGAKPVIFGLGIISTDAIEFCGSFSPDYSIFCFTRYSRSKKICVIMEMRRQPDGNWSSPRVASFSGEFSEVDAIFAPDGKLYYCSNRPLKNKLSTKPAPKDADIWVVEATPTGWSQTRHLGFPLNSVKEDYYPSLTSKGVLYFVSNRPGGLGHNDYYRAEPLPGGGYKIPQNLGPVINTKQREGDGYISPDEKCFIFSAFVDEQGNKANGTLYVSYRGKSGKWSKKQRFGSQVNSRKGNEFTPLITPDGKFFFFATEKTGNDEIYWMDVKALDLKNEVLFTVEI